MYPVSQDVINLFKANQYQQAKVEVFTPAANVLEPVNGVSATPDLTIGPDRILQNGLVVDRYCVTGEKLEIGTAIAAELTLKLNNHDGYFDDTVFKGKWLKAQVGIKDWSDETAAITWVPLGWFVVDSVPRKLSTITVRALDFMTLTDKLLNPPFVAGLNKELSTSGLRGALTGHGFGFHELDSNFSAPGSYVWKRAPLEGVLDSNLVERATSYIANFLGVVYSSIPAGAKYGADWLATLDEAERVNRQFVRWGAQLLGANAYIDYNGHLHFGWLQDTGLSITSSDRYSSDMAEDDVTVTGVSCTAYGSHTYSDDEDPDDPSPSTFEAETEAQYIAGNATGIVVDITGNKLFGENSVPTVLSDIYDLVGGTTYRPFEAKVKPCPYLWPMDKITYIDAEGVSHDTIITNITFTINAPTSVAAKGESNTSSGSPSAGTTGSYEKLNVQKAVVKGLSADTVEAKEVTADKLIGGDSGLAIEANSIQFTVAKGSFRPYYTAGDTVTITRMYCAGGVTGGGTNLYFYIPLAKPLIGVSNVTISNPTEAIITGRKIEGGYIAQDATVSSLGAPSCAPYEGGVTIGIKASSAYNTKNNTPVTVTPENLVLKFT